jgi:hypothetical protein
VDQERHVELDCGFVDRVPPALAHGRHGRREAFHRVRVEHPADEAELEHAALQLLDPLLGGRVLGLGETADAFEAVRECIDGELDDVVGLFAEPLHDRCRLFRVHQGEGAR